MDSIEGCLRKISDPGGGSSESCSRMSSSSSVNRKFSAPSCQALKTAVSTLYRIDDFHMIKIGSGFFSDVFKVTHKTSHKVMVLKLNKHRSNRNNMLKEVQLMNKLCHPNILKLEAACVNEGQLHALTEYINGGSLEQLIQRKEEELPWSIRMSIALDIAKGLAYLHSKGMFHRDLTSKNVLIHRDDLTGVKAVIGDFGLAAKIPARTNKLENIRLPQVGSPYWMSPECLRGKYYDEKADIFSYGIIMCELIGRVDADPDVLPRTENFGLDYIAFSAMCPSCPPDFLKLTYNCVKVDPNTRLTAHEIIEELLPILDIHSKLEPKNSIDGGKIHLRKVGHKRSLSEEEIVVRKKSPSEKARFHYFNRPSVMSIGKEMSMKDPHYKPALQNPFATLPRLREGKKIIGSSGDLFSSCFELPSPARVSTPTTFFEDLSTPTKSASLYDLKVKRSKFEDHLFFGRVEYLKRLYSGNASVSWTTQDDSVLSSFSSCSSSSESSEVASLQMWKRRGSCESGFFSVDDWLSMQLSTTSTRSIGSSLLTVSDLEEDLRAASAFLSSTNKRTSSIFTDSTDDLSSLAEIEPCEIPKLNFEKDIRDIVEYFEASCHISGKKHRGLRYPRVKKSSSQNPADIKLLPRSAKIDSLIKRVVEKESRDRLSRNPKIPGGNAMQQQRLQICDGIVRSKLQVFDETKRTNNRILNPNHQGFVKAKLAIFDSKPNVASATAGNAKKLAEKRLLALANASTKNNISSLQKEFKK